MTSKALLCPMLLNMHVAVCHSASLYRAIGAIGQLGNWKLGFVEDGIDASGILIAAGPRLEIDRYASRSPRGV